MVEPIGTSCRIVLFELVRNGVYATGCDDTDGVDVAEAVAVPVALVRGAVAEWLVAAPAGNAVPSAVPPTTQATAAAVTRALRDGGVVRPTTSSCHTSGSPCEPRDAAHVTASVV